MAAFFDITAPRQTSRDLRLARKSAMRREMMVIDYGDRSEYGLADMRHGLFYQGDDGWQIYISGIRVVTAVRLQPMTPEMDITTSAKFGSPLTSLTSMLIEDLSAVIIMIIVSDDESFHLIEIECAFPHLIQSYGDMAATIAGDNNIYISARSSYDYLYFRRFRRYQVLPFSFLGQRYFDF